MDSQHDLHEEAAILYKDIKENFKYIYGPPRITLSVARGVDDNQHNDLRRLYNQQKHHKSWQNVTQEEIETYHDCWPFLDAESFGFYIPAFMANYIFTEVIDKDYEVNYISEPIWLTYVDETNALFIKLTDELNPSQKEILFRFKSLIKKYKRPNQSFHRTRETRR